VSLGFPQFDDSSGMERSCGSATWVLSETLVRSRLVLRSIGRMALVATTLPLVAFEHGGTWKSRGA
jgi:hypothetical protein